MEFEYDVKENEILLKRCYGTEERIEVPAQIEGMPVTVLAPYIFSQARRKPDQKAAVFVCIISICSGEYWIIYIVSNI